MRSQKKQTSAMRAEWAQAVKEGRVLRFEGGRFVSYPTIEMRDRALQDVWSAGLTAEIVSDSPNRVQAHRPPKEWIDACIAGVTKSGGAKASLGGPPAVCGKVWFDKPVSAQEKIIKKAQASHPYEVKLGRKTVSLHKTAAAAERAAKAVGGLARKRATKKIVYEVSDAQNRAVAHACSCAAAHRAARSSKHFGSSVNLARSRTRIPSLVDRGYGIGAHGWNDMLVKPGGGFQSVRQIIVYDVHGENATRYDLDSGKILDIDVRKGEVSHPRWTWDQVREVVSRDLATFGRSFGEPYGEVRDSTIYGLYYGKRPKWMDKATWERRKSQPSTLHAGLTSSGKLVVPGE